MRIGGFFVAGELWIRVIDGEIELFGARYGQGSEIHVPPHRAAPITSLRDTTIGVKFGEDSFIAESDKRLIPEDWEELYSYVKGKGNGYTIMAIGNVDTGKTGLITYLANKLFSDGKKVGIVDADTGQSDIGPPTTIGLGTLEKPIIHLSEAKLIDAFFVGNVTPAGVLDRSITGTYRMVKEGKRQGYDIILVDTTGWVSDRWGRELKTMKYLTIDPDLVVFIEKFEDELFHLKRTISGLGANIFEVSSPPRLGIRSREERRNIRFSLFQKEFENAKEIAIELDSIGINYGFLGTGREPSEETKEVLMHVLGQNLPYVEESEDALLLLTETKLSSSIINSLKLLLGKREVVNITMEDIRHLLVCLTDKQGHYLGLGIIIGFDQASGNLFVLTNAREEQISNIQFGHIKVSPSGVEEGKFSPWMI